MTKPTAAASAPAAGSDYNVIPYTSKPFPQSAPPRLAALATLFGLSPPAVSEARVLELGCAAGGNIIPLALRFPGAHFRGVDLAERHVGDGQARIAALEVKNVRIEQADLTALDLKGERFDYIICHGVYSWVPEAARAAILRICGDNLADHGVAYVSYNVYPGWQLRGVIRDMMAYHAGPEADPAMRVAKGRWVIENVAKATPAGTPYGEMLRQEAKSLATRDDDYILTEFLQQDNAPCYFHEFAARAHGFGLTYLCDTDIGECFPEHMGPETGRLIRTMSANHLVPIEQYMDFFKGRTFRQSLLVKLPQDKIQRLLTPDRIRDLHVSAWLTCVARPDGSWTFTGRNGSTLNTTDAAMHRALQRLSEVYPATRTVRELVAEVRAPDKEAMISDAVFQAVLIGVAELSTVPLRLDPVAKPKAKPKAARLVRLDASQRTGWTTGPDHSMVPLDVVSMVLLPLMDGTRDRDALKAGLLAAVRDKLIQLKDAQTGLEPTGAALDAAAAKHVDQAIERLAIARLVS
jgi:methyltransferase-like protein/trans-aconitate methyltransferase